MWPTMSCSTKWCRKPPVEVVHHRRGRTAAAAPASSPICSATSSPGDAVAHQRLVHVEVEEPHLGVGDLRERLAVHAHELQEGDEREARVEHVGHLLEHLDVLGGQVVERWANPSMPKMPLDQRRLEAGRARGLPQRDRRRRCGQQLLDVAECQAPLVVARRISLSE